MNGEEESVSKVMDELRARSNEASRAGMARYGIDTTAALGGSSVPQMRAMARRLGKNHAVAAALWSTGVHEARILATMVDEPTTVTEEQMEAWALEFRSWDLCDQCCTNLFVATPYAWPKAVEWPRRPEEFVRRAGFVLMAVLAVHDKKAPDARFLDLLPVIENGADDDRNFVRKAVNWALRQIGKRDMELNRAAVECALRIAGRESKAARWIAADALRELRDDVVQARLQAREIKKHGKP
ncbi:MAG: DNA alkylation repair protein [Methanomassiliicoccus sp.]|nr:DNA alkylation repair protein [Methanomassiliicoccus sp.]